MLPICTPRLVLPTAALAVGAALVLPACASVSSGVDAVALGYGPADATLAGYDDDPVPRPRVTGWAPPPRDPQDSFGAFNEPDEDAPVDPVAYVDDVQGVCTKLGALGSDEAETPCLRRQRIVRLFRTIDKWKLMVACVDAARDLDDVAACERDNPPAFAVGDEYPRETDTCLHVLALTIVENAGPEPMMGAAELQEFAPLMRDCVDTLVHEQRDERGPKPYFEMLDCIDAALTTDDAEVCEQ